jgi:small subunit ribosomal protein S3
MGQKVNPIGLRLGIIRDWDSRWYAGKSTYREWVLADAKVRGLLRKRFTGGDGGGRRGTRSRNRDAGISRIEIERAPNMLKLTLHTAKPGIIIGRGGRGVEDIRADIERIVGQKVHINVQEVRQPELDAQLVAENVAGQLERRIAFKRAVRQAVQRSMRMGAQGVRVMLAGRLGGTEMSRVYSDRDGKIPLHTLRADVDYGFTEATTASGNIGVKAWIYRGDVLPKAPAPEERIERPAAAPERPRRGWRRVGVRRAEAAETAEAEPAVEGAPEPAASVEEPVAAPEATAAAEEPAAAPEPPAVAEEPVAAEGAAGPGQPEAAEQPVVVEEPAAESPTELAETAGEPEASERPEGEASAPAEEQTEDVDAVEGQASEATERPAEG